MQATVIIPEMALRSLFEQVFSEPVTVSAVYSDYGEHIRRFSSAREMEEHRNDRAFESYALHYSDVGGHVEERRIALDPKKCAGHTFRYSMDGWGLIQIQVKNQGDGLVECSIAANSEKRAEAWADTHPEYKAPNLWNWTAVEKHTRRLIRHLRKSAAQQNGNSAGISREG